MSFEYPEYRKEGELGEKQASRSDEKEGIEYYDSWDEVVSVIKSITGITLDNISEAEDKLSAFNDDDTFLIINEISVA